MTGPGGMEREPSRTWAPADRAQPGAERRIGPGRAGGADERLAWTPVWPEPPGTAQARPDRVWIAWERQRRSLELARRLGADLRLCLHEDRGWLRYPLSIRDTWRILRRSRGKAVFVQNPSMLLAAMAGLLKGVLGYHLAVDRHSNFPFLTGIPPGWKRLGTGLLSDLTLRLADITLVTNPELAEHVERRGGRPLVLPDPFPRVPAAALEASAFLRPRPPEAPKEVLFVSSWAFDEPITAVMAACKALEGKVNVRITGRVKPAFAPLMRVAPANFIPTGWLSEADYFALMARCDAVIAVTSRACTLVCGAYEAIALGKPMILGGSAALREYFDEGAVYTDGSVPDLVRALEEVLEDLPARHAAVRRLLERRAPEWEGRFDSLEHLVDSAVAGRARRRAPVLLDYPVDAALEG